MQSWRGGGGARLAPRTHARRGLVPQVELETWDPET